METKYDYEYVAKYKHEFGREAGEVKSETEELLRTELEILKAQLALVLEGLKPIVPVIEEPDLQAKTIYTHIRPYIKRS